MVKNLKANDRPENEIDLYQLGKLLYVRRSLIFLVTLVFVILGVFFAIFTPNEYKATTALLPKSSTPSSGSASLGGLASLAGINLGNVGNNAEIPPALYPKFVSSVQFQKALISAPIHVEGSNEKITYQKYFEEFIQPDVTSTIKKYTIGLPRFILSAIRKSPNVILIRDQEVDIIRLTPEEMAHFARLEKQLTIKTDSDGLITLSFSMPEPLMAAQMAQFAQDLLQKEIINYKIANAREQLKFTEDRFSEKKLEFDQIQSRLANFRDRNQNIITASAQNQLQRLEAEYSIAFNMFNELASQMEQSKIQVAKDTPIFSIIQPVTVPIAKSAPNKPLIIIIFTILGVFISITYIFGLEFIALVKQRWQDGDNLSGK